MLTLVTNNQQPMQEAHKAIETHYRKNCGSLVPRYTKFLNSTERAEDVVQEAYTRALTYWHDCPIDQEELGKWLNIIMGNCLKDNHRDHIMQGGTMRKDEQAPEEVVEAAAIPAIIYREVVKRIDAKPDNQAQVLRLFLLQQYKPTEIEQLVPESAVTIRKMVSRFRKDIKQELGWEI